MRPKRLILLIVISILLTGVFYLVNHKRPTTNSVLPERKLTKQTVPETDPPQIISTNPDPLEETIISATQEVEITFNRSLENVGEFKVRIEPEIEFKVELSGDRKTAKIIPTKPYELGTTYTLFIGTETKFDGVGRWGQEKTFHFRTIRYRGI